MCLPKDNKGNYREEVCKALMLRVRVLMSVWVLVSLATIATASCLSLHFYIFRPEVFCRSIAQIC